jgi:hypothetical protein
VQKTICTWLGSLSSRRIGELSAKVYQYISKFLVLHPKKHRLFCIAIYNIFVKPCPKWLVSPKSHHQISPHRRVRGAILLKAAASVSILVQDG